MPLFLTSLGFDGLAVWLDQQLAGRSAHRSLALIANASRDLPDPAAVVRPAEEALRAAGWSPRRVDARHDATGELGRAAAVMMTGGDPFRLLADLRAAGADRALSDLHRRGVPIVGQSAGALVCGPDLTPARLTSPFDAPAGLELKGLGLCPWLVLPHHGEPGRSARHRRAARSVPSTLPLTPLWNDETLLVQDDTWVVARARRRTRPAVAADAGQVAQLFQQATREAWASFLGAERLERAQQPESLWGERISAAGERFLVTEDAAGTVGFVLYGDADPALGPTVGEIELLYTHPRVWGDGSGRRLLERATWNLYCAGYRQAVLWTEYRNSRALTMYRRNGWRLDGAVDERDYLGASIRNLRHRIDLNRHAGGD